MPKRDHLDKQGRHLGAMSPMSYPQDVLVAIDNDAVKLGVATGKGAASTDLGEAEVRGLIFLLESAWSRVYGEQK
jgi:hypothetical protein